MTNYFCASEKERCPGKSRGNAAENDRSRNNRDNPSGAIEKDNDPRFCRCDRVHGSAVIRGNIDCLTARLINKNIHGRGICFGYEGIYHRFN